MSEYEPPLEPWWTPRRLFYLGVVIIGSLACPLYLTKTRGNWSVDFTWLVRPIYHLVRHILGY